MSFIGTLHEISFYGILATIICFIKKSVTFSELWYSAFHIEGITGIFKCYLFWSCALFIPIALIGALVTKYLYQGEGLTFNSDNLLVIAFAHIAEEVLGLICTPFWFLRDLINKDFDFWKVVDYIVYAALLVFIIIELLIV